LSIRFESDALYTKIDPTSGSIEPYSATDVATTGVESPLLYKPT